MPLISKPEHFTDKCFALGTDPTTFSEKSDYLKKIYILGAMSRFVFTFHLNKFVVFFSETRLLIHGILISKFSCAMG